LPAASNQHRPLFAVTGPDRCGSGGTGLTHPVNSFNTRPLTVPADAPLSVAALKMEHRHAERLLVTGEDGRLLGVVSRADVLRPLTRPDTAIRDDVIENVLRRALWIDPGRVHVDVHDGVVTLTGTVDRRTTAGIAERLTGHVAGVTAVVDRLHFEFDDTALARSRVNRTHPFSAEPFHPRRHTRSAA
jgi:CBS domain-containing protein